MVKLLGENRAVALVSQLLHVLLLGLIQVDGERILSVQECSDLGFTSQLQCGWCSSLPESLQAALKDDCMKCCEEEMDESSVKKYHGATLEVCG